jgi:hypothetical protein
VCKEKKKKKKKRGREKVGSTLGNKKCKEKHLMVGKGKVVLLWKWFFVKMEMNE